MDSFDWKKWVLMDEISRQLDTSYEVPTKPSLAFTGLVIGWIGCTIPYPLLPRPPPMYPIICINFDPRPWVWKSKVGEGSSIVLSNETSTLEERDCCISFCKQTIVSSFYFKLAKKCSLRRVNFSSISLMRVVQVSTYASWSSIRLPMSLESLEK